MRALDAMRAVDALSASVEDDGLVAEAEDAVVEMPGNGAGKHDALQIATARDEIFNLIAVGNARNILLDDGSVVESRGDVVAGGPDELDTTLVGGVVWARADEGRQKRVVDVDDGGRIGGDKGRRKNLHVAGEDEKLDLVLGEQTKLRGFSLSARLRCDRNVVKRDAVEGGQRLDVSMVGQDERDLAGEFAGADTVHQVGGTVEVLRAEEGDTRTLPGETQLPAHVERCGQRREDGAKGGDEARKIGGVCLAR